MSSNQRTIFTGTNNGCNRRSPQPPEKSSSKHLWQLGREIILECVEFEPDKYMNDKEIHSVLKNFVSLQHPYIDPIIYAASNENGCAVVRRFHKEGTLKDILCMSTPKNPFLSKYDNPKARTALTLKQIDFYGRQMLIKTESGS